MDAAAKNKFTRLSELPAMATSQIGFLNPGILAHQLELGTAPFWS